MKYMFELPSVEFNEILVHLANTFFFLINQRGILQSMRNVTVYDLEISVNI